MGSGVSLVSIHHSRPGHWLEVDRNNAIVLPVLHSAARLGIFQKVWDPNNESHSTEAELLPFLIATLQTKFKINC